MSTLWRLHEIVVRRSYAAVAALMLFVNALPAYAAVTLTADPADRYGTSPNVFTIDPFVPAETPRAQRGVINTRKLRQSFKNPASFNVGQINLSFDVTGGTTVGSVDDTGLRIAIYELDNVGVAWSPGTLMKEFTIQPGGLVGSNQVLRFDLTGGDVFSLPARFAGTTGYGLEISTPFSNPSDGNPGVLVYTTTSAYADGGQYSETGAFNARDVGLSLVASAGIACAPGDVDCMNGVTIADLQIIANHFRQAANRENGDLSGNGIVDFDDFDEWKRHYSGPGLAASDLEFLSVPEPAAVFLILNGLVCVALYRSRRGLSLN